VGTRLHNGSPNIVLEYALDYRASKPNRKKSLRMGAEWRRWPAQPDTFARVKINVQKGKRPAIRWGSRDSSRKVRATTPKVVPRVGGFLVGERGAEGKGRGVGERLAGEKEAGGYGSQVPRRAQDGDSKPSE